MNSQIRPVRFTPPDTIDDSSVQLHLGHRIAKRLLSRFLSQGFIHHDMSRACLGQSDDAVPRVVLLGRLGLFGKGATRLHEEIITITARWESPEKRGGSLKAYARDAEARTMEILENSLLSDQSSLPAEVQNRLLTSIESDVSALRPLLAARSEDSEKIARQKLQVRAEAEANAMTNLLDDQKKRVEAKLATYRDLNQPELPGMPEDERRQRQEERKAQERFLTDYKTQISEEPARIRDFYKIEVSRVEPIGLVYLWPSQNLKTSL
jgi:hypothetical protein